MITTKEELSVVIPADWVPGRMRTMPLFPLMGGVMKL
jgi:hypothetical protein